MSGRRVVVTGMAGLCALGDDWPAVRRGLREGRSGVVRVPALEAVAGLRTQLGAPAPDPVLPEAWPRKKLRGMGRVARLAAQATDRALREAGLLGAPELGGGGVGLAYGSTTGSPPDLVDYARAFGVEHSTRGVVPIQYARMMSHTCSANLAQLFEIRGRVLSTCSACTSGSQAIGAGYEQIRFGRQEVMICGGAEELHPIETAVFDLLFATSTKNDAPGTTPRPFDRDRDGLVVGEGAATLVLESLEHARARGVPVLGEVVGYGSNCDGLHLMAPDSSGMEGALREALADAALDASAVGYVNAHATATEVGDIAESAATARVLGEGVPTSSLKGHMGHTLGACGALEAWITLVMLAEGWVAPTLHLECVDPRCAPLDYVRGAPRALEVELAMSNNFAFGGVNTSLLLRRGDAV